MLTVDTHVDTLHMLLQPGFDITRINDVERGGGQVDFPRMKEGGLEDCRDASELGRITVELIKRGYTEVQIRKIWGENLLRTMAEAQRLA